MRRFLLGLPAAVLLAGGLHAQSFTTGPCHDDEGNTHNNSWFSGHQVRVCELRSTTLPLVNGQVRVEGKNGGIEVIGEDRKDIALEARVIAQSSSRDQAETIVREVKIKTDGTIKADGPMMSGWFSSNWQVDYKLRVPRHLAAQLETQNGGIEVENIDGKIDASTTNGGLGLHHLAGEVHASTVNGGLHVTLDGPQWRGAGMFAKSTNGGVSVKAPEHYSAHLVAGTVNGGISVGFPEAGNGRRHHIDTNLGSGGPTVSFETVNGGVSVDRE
jgi:DUF4097 and DUF4098 domain-containing protein YvlB